MTVDVSKLKKLAEAAPRERWWFRCERWEGYGRFDPHHGKPFVELTIGGERFIAADVDRETAIGRSMEFVAAANPSAILSLLSRLESAEEKLRFYADVLRPRCREKEHDNGERARSHFTQFEKGEECR